MPSRRRDREPVARSGKPATSPEARESQLINLAYDLAEQQLRDGTASSQVISSFLKLGSSREELEQERIRHENELSRVKREAIESQKRSETMFEEAIAAFRSYSGQQPPEPDDEFYYDED